jgi:hypothetical protein
MRSRLVTYSLAAVCLFAAIPASQAGSDVKLLVVREHGVGSAAQAQPYVDKLVAVAQKLQGWSSASGKYAPDRATAETYIKDSSPQFGIMSLPTYLAMHESQKLEVIGQVNVTQKGGQQYFVVSKSGGDISSCKGGTLATVEDDTRFIDKIVSGGAFKLSDFTVNTMKRPLQPIKAVVNDEAKCALIDDAQLSDPTAKDLKTVWKSATMMPMAVVAFGANASSADKGSLKTNLPSLCNSDDGKKACSDAGIQSLKSASESDYAQVLAAYK